MSKHRPEPAPMTAPHRSPPGSSLLDRLVRLPARTLDRWIVAAICLLIAIVFFHTLEGAWVYDDGMQIVGNPLIKDPTLYRQAMLSDVWSFRSTGGETGSRYWRPTFVAWMVGHYRLFGVDDPVAWHLSTILTHMLASVLAFLFVRRLGLSPLLGATIALIFALHPSRVESVAWISGVTDPMLAVFLFAIMLLLLRIAGEPIRLPAANRSSAVMTSTGNGLFAYLRRAPGLWVIALVIYALALGTKEVAALFPLIVAVLCLRWENRRFDEPSRLDRASIVPAIGAAIPFILLAAIYLICRTNVLGPDPASTDGRAFPFVVSLFTLPRVGLFYVVQGLLPIRISPVYDLQHVLKPTFTNFFLPGIGFLAVGLAMLWAALGAPRGKVTTVGLALFVCILAPAAYSSHFPPDFLVHDRYLYIPLAGLLLLVMGVLLWATRQMPRDKLEVGVLAFGVLAMSLLGWQTLRYGDAWKSNLTIWQWGYREQPNSQFAIHHYALELLGESSGLDARAEKADREGRAAERDAMRAEAQRVRAKAEGLFVRAIEISPSGTSYLAMADAMMGDGKYDDAERTLKMVIGQYRAARHFPPDYVYALDSLARVYLERDDKLDAAVDVYRPALAEVPLVIGRIYDRMAMITIRWAQLHEPPTQTERWEQARVILETGLSKVSREATTESRMLHFRLGQVYAKQGRLEDAATQFGEFLRVTEGFEERTISDARDVAKQSIEQIRKLKPGT